ncbi:MAG: carboxylate--amine ligase, partial [bacterium]|nr:carboxylate--amine ligase [bacterium]
MNFVFISPHFPPTFFNFCVELKKAGANVLAIGDASYQEFRQELKDSLTEYSKIDMLDYDKVYRTIAYFASKYGKIDRIDSQNEYWLDLEAKLRIDFNIFGQRPEDLKVNQSKLGMKKVFKDVGVPCADAILVANPDILNNFVEKHGFPLIIKPDKGMGAANTYKINNEWELSDVLKDLPPGYIAEPFVEGKIVTFDGLVDKSGDIMFYSSFELSDNVLDILTNKKDMYYYYTRDIPEQLVKYGRRVVKGFNLKERFFHCEFFRRHDGQHMALEINVRPPGGFSLDMQNFSCDMDLYKTWAQLVVNGKDTLQYERKFNVSNVSRRDHLSYVHSKDQIFDKLGDIVVEYTRIPEAFAEAMGNDTYLLRHKNLEVLHEAINFVRATN